MFWVVGIPAVVVALGGLVGAAGFAVQLALQGRTLPGQPLHTVLNPFNHLARPDTWTPEMRVANRRAVTCGLVALGGVLTFAAGIPLGQAVENAPRTRTGAARRAVR